MRHTCAPRHESEWPQSCPYNRKLTASKCREKKQRRDTFDLADAVHLAEYERVKRPIDPKTKKHLEPAHRFEVNLEGDSVSQAKSVP